MSGQPIPRKDTDRLDWLIESINDCGFSLSGITITRKFIDRQIDANERYELKQEKLQADAREDGENV